MTGWLLTPLTYQRKLGPRVAIADHMSRPRSSPRALLEESRTTREKADELETQAIRAALEQAQGLVARAAELLGVTQGWLSGLLRDGRKHEALGREAERLRDAAGYHGGKPAQNLPNPTKRSEKPA